MQIGDLATNTTMLNDIVEAHQPHTSNTEANTSTTIDANFFFRAGGQEEELKEIHQYGDECDHNYDEQDLDEQDRNENDVDNSDRNTENSDQDSEEDNNSEQEFSDNAPPYD